MAALELSPKEVGETLVAARAELNRLRASGDARLVAAGEFWTGALGALLDLAEAGDDVSPEQAAQHVVRMASYLVRGVDELRAWTSSLAARLPPDLAELALGLSSLMKRARSGELELEEEAAAILAEAERRIGELCQRD